MTDSLWKTHSGVIGEPASTTTQPPEMRQGSKSPISAAFSVSFRETTRRDYCLVQKTQGELWFKHDTESKERQQSQPNYIAQDLIITGSDIMEFHLASLSQWDDRVKLIFPLCIYILPTDQIIALRLVIKEWQLVDGSVIASKALQIK